MTEVAQDLSSNEWNARQFNLTVLTFVRAHPLAWRGLPTPRRSPGMSATPRFDGERLRRAGWIRTRGFVYYGFSLLETRVFKVALDAQGLLFDRACCANSNAAQLCATTAPQRSRCGHRYVVTFESAALVVENEQRGKHVRFESLRVELNYGNSWLALSASANSWRRRCHSKQEPSSRTSTVAHRPRFLRRNGS